jgi:hypothetical protein
MMRALHHCNRVLHVLWISVLAAAIGSAGLAGSASAGNDQPGSPPAAPGGESPSGGSGMVIYVDPQTGAILRQPAPGAAPLLLSPQQQNALSTSHQGLVEVPSSVPGGGVKVDLQGRFRSPVIGTIGADGQLRLQHLPETPTATPTK